MKLATLLIVSLLALSVLTEPSKGKGKEPTNTGAPDPVVEDPNGEPSRHPIDPLPEDEGNVESSNMEVHGGEPSKHPLDTLVEDDASEGSKENSTESSKSSSGPVYQSGSTKDDFHENTDVVRFSNETHNSWDENQAQKELDKNEDLLGDIVEGELSPPPVVVVEWIDKVLPDGRMVKVKTTRVVKVTKSKIIRRVRRYWNSSISLASVKPIIISFTNVYGKELNQTQLDLFNHIATTDEEGHFKFNYNYVQVRLEHLRATLKAITDIFYTPLSQCDLDSLEATIRNCTDPVVTTMNTDAGESYTASGWTVRFEALFSTCGKGKPGVQLVTYAASKSGGWVCPSAFSVPNSHTVDAIITQWLIRHLYLLFTCTDADLPVKATACSDPHSIHETSGHGHHGHHRRRI